MKNLREFFPQNMSMQFTHGHAMMAGSLPKGVSVEAVSKALAENATEDKIESFGLFDSSANNYNTFYPEATPESWAPTDEEFVFIPFRMLSETIVHKMGVPIDFGMNGILKKSMTKMMGQTINMDHEVMIGNAIGAVSEVSWQNAYKLGDKEIPAGMNGVFKIDAKANPRIARGLTMDPPSIHSDSVTVRFTHKRSHEFENESEFWEKAGTYGKDGELIRLIVTDITLYAEVSLVSHGADAFAQILTPQGRIQNPEMTERGLSLSSDDNMTGFDFKDILTIKNTIDNFNNTDDDMELKELLLSLGLEESSFDSVEAVNAHFATLTADKASYDAILTVKEDLTPENLQVLITDAADTGEGELSAEDTAILAYANNVETPRTLEFMQEAITNSESFLNDLRTETTKHFKLLNPDGNEVLEANITNADKATLEALHTQYLDEVTEKIPLKCNECGSTHLGRNSAKKPEGEKDHNTFAEKQEKFYNKRRRKQPGDVLEEKN